MPENKTFSHTLIKWYSINKRDLPWRENTSPYSVWLSEIILQQTRVNQGLSYYNHFIEHYPTVNDLASANEEDILRSWQGLGYYSRARNLHAAAKQVVQDFNGEFPSTSQELKKLKGVGDYTAAAIASFCFKEVSPVIDGNVFRVLSRIFGITEDIALPKSRTIFLKRAEDLISQRNPDTFNQAIMEFGALQCTPKSPSCGICPFSHQCYAFQYSEIKSLPVKIKKVKIKTRYFHYFIQKYDELIVMQKRGEGDIWQYLYEPLLIESEKDQIIPYDLLKTNKLEITNLQADLKPIKHILSHQKIFAYFHRVTLTKNDFSKLDKDHEFYNSDEIEALPKPILVANYLSKINF